MAEDGRIRCDACPVLCYIKPGMTGACDRYANHAGTLVRVDPQVVLDGSAQAVPFLEREADWDGDIVGGPTFLTAIGAGTTYPDYKPAPFIVASEVDGVDMVTVVTEGIFSYCGVKVKIDTDRHHRSRTQPGPRRGRADRARDDRRYGSQMLSLGGVHHLTGSGKKTGRVTCEALLALSNCQAVELTVDDGAALVIQAGQPPVINGEREARMRVGCGSATIGMFARQWLGKADEVVVVDDHITGVLSEHQAGKVLGIRRHRFASARPSLHAGALLRGGQPGHRLGRHRHRRSALDPRTLRPEEGAARPDHADGQHHRGTRRLFRTRRRRCARSSATCPRRWRSPSSASRRTASRRWRACCSWAAPAALCAPG